MGYGLVSAVLVVLLGRIGDMYGRVRIYNLGFVVFTLAAVALSLVWMTGPAAALVHHRPAHDPGGRRRHDHGQRGRHPHRRLPPRRARHGARHQHGRRTGRLVHRARPRRRAGGRRLAPGLSDQRAGRHSRNDLGVPAAPRDRRAQEGAHRLAGQPHVRGRPLRWSSSASPTGSSPTATRPWAGAAPSC